MWRIGDLSDPSQRQQIAYMYICRCLWIYIPSSIDCCSLLIRVAGQTAICWKWPTAQADRLYRRIGTGSVKCHYDLLTWIRQWPAPGYLPRLQCHAVRPTKYSNDFS